MIRPRSALLPLLSLALAGCAETASTGLTGPRVPAAGTATAESRRPHACIVQGGELRNVEVRISATGDTLAMDGRPFAEAYPATLANGYAAQAEWYRKDNEAHFQPGGISHHKLGLPRVITPEMAIGGKPVLVRFGEYRGVGLFAVPDELGRPGATAHDLIVYVPVGPGCLWQPYEYPGYIRNVRDEP